MQTTTKLRPLFSYSLLWIIVIIVIISLIIYVYFKKKNKKDIVVNVPLFKDMIRIKEQYIYLINNLINKVNSKSISNRKAYQELSLLIRNFIFEMTGIRVQYYTLKDIEFLNMPFLYELVKEYYDPEFAYKSEGNIMESINKTKGMIERWS